MPEISQVTFLGSSVRNFNTTLGWGNNVSTCTINLVDDPTNGDSFAPPLPGTPCYFNYNDFRFGGLLQSYKTINVKEGYPTFEVTLIDPREILEGVQIIIDEYIQDTTGIPNLFNAYGWWENNFGYGRSEVNDSGMPWEKIRIAIEDIQVAFPVRIGNYAFYLDLEGLPTLDSNYRIGGGVSVSVMEYINRICEDAGCDFFFRLEFSNGADVIRCYAISRVAQPTFGKITQYIRDNTVGTPGTEYGVEFRNETTTKFLIGGKVSKIYLQTPSLGSVETLVDDTLIQFWGTNEDGTPIIGQYTDEQLENEDLNNYRFTIPSRLVNVLGVGSTYTTDVMEMRAVLGGQAAWETYLWSQNNIENSPHFNKARRLGITSNIRQDIKDVLSKEYGTLDRLEKLDIRTLAPFTGYILNRQGAYTNFYEENIHQLFEYLSSYANEYYGKKYMVRIPFVYAKLDSDTGQITTSVEPTDGGYLEESNWRRAIDLNYLPRYINNITLEDNRIQPYIRVDSANLYDLSDISPDEIIFEEKQSGSGPIAFAFIKCSMDPRIYFLNNTTLFSPRAVINIPGRVMPLGIQGDSFNGILKTILQEHIEDKLGVNDQTIIEDTINKIFARFGSEQLMYGLAGLPHTPDLAGLALQSNIETYGPWYALGAIGRLEVEQDSNLVPWEYGGYTNLNLIGEAKVNSAVTTMQHGETGSITVVGAPTGNVGDQLLNGGPYITNISVQVDQGGVTTTYRMETWTPRFGKVQKSYIERFAKFSKIAQAQRRQLRTLFSVPAPGSRFFKKRENALLNRSERTKPHTSHTFIAGEVFDNASGTKSSNVVISPTYNMPGTITENNFSKKAFTSLDGIFRPFSTSTTSTSMAHFETPTTSGDFNRNANDLNPYKNGTDISVFANGTALPADTANLMDVLGEDRRAMALRGPLVLSGWGYDTSGKPVPNSGQGTDNFLGDYLQRSDQWKTGPVDLQWDDRRKVWIGGGSSFRIAKLKQTLVGGSYASGVLLIPVINSNTKRITSWTEVSGDIRIYDGFEFSYPTTPSGARVYVSQEKTTNEWFVTAAGVF
jgi:hypothetical protein